MGNAAAVMTSSSPTPRYPIELDAQALEFAKNYLIETPEKRKEYLERLRTHFLTNEPEIQLSTEDDFLVAFLRGCKYDFERAVAKVKNYYAMRTDLPLVFGDRDPLQERMQELLQLGCFVPLRKMLDGRVIIIIRPGAYNPREFQLEEILKIGYVILDVCSKICPLMQIYGVCAVFDMQGITFAHARTITHTIIKHMVNSWENYHCRPKQLEFINAPMYINVILNIFKSFMSQKLKDRVRVHYGGFEALHEFIDKAVLPKEYGGSDGTMQQHSDFWVQQITSYRDWLIFDEQFKIIKDDDASKVLT